MPAYLCRRQGALVKPIRLIASDDPDSRLSSRSGAPQTEVNITNQVGIVCDEATRARLTATRERLMGSMGNVNNAPNATNVTDKVIDAEVVE